MFHGVYKKWVVLWVVVSVFLTGCSGNSGAGDGSTSGYLASLSLSAGTLTPSFDASVTHYSVQVPHSTTSLTVTTSVPDTMNLEVNGASAGHANSYTIYLSVGTQTVTFDVTYGTTANPLTRTYTLDITRAVAPTDVNLSSLTVDSGTLSPAFASSTLSYSVTVPYSVSSIGVTPTAADVGASLTVNGAGVTSGQASGAIALNVGANVITVVSSNGASGLDLVTKTYTVTVNRTAASSVATLAGLTLGSGSLSPAFASNVFSYTATVGYSLEELTLTATTSDSLASLEVNGITEVSGTPSSTQSLNVGPNGIAVVVTAEDGTTTGTYVITVTRAAASTNANLSSLIPSTGALSPAFSASTLSYTMSVGYATDSIQFTPSVAVNESSLTINGSAEPSGNASSAYPLNVGANIFTVVVTAEDGSTTKSYTVTVTRGAPSTNNNLSGISVSPGVLTPSFSPSTTQYTVLISNAATDFVATATAADANATIEGSWNSGNFDPMTSSVPSPSLMPNVGTNTLNLRVTSQSGAIANYEITVIYDACGAGYYDSGDHACTQVGLGYYSPLADNDRYTCSNKPLNAHYTSPTADNLNCAWSCDTGYLTTNGIACLPYPNATILSCNDDEVAVGLYGRSGSIIDRLGVRCASIVNGVVSSVVRDGPSYGGSGGTAFSSTCASGNVAFEIDGDLATYVGVPRTGRLRFRCLDVVSEVLSAWNPSTYWGNSNNLGNINFQCGSGVNQYGSYVNGIIIDNAGGAAYVGPLLGITCR